MAEQEKTEKKFADDKKLGELLAKANEQIGKELKGRPYLLVIASGYPVEYSESEGKSKLAAQWSWRSNVIVNNEDGPRVMEFLAEQLKDVTDHPESGIKAKYTSAKQTSASTKPTAKK